MTPYLIAIVFLVVGFIMGLMFANDHWCERLCNAHVEELPMKVEGWRYYVLQEERYRELLMANTFYTRTTHGGRKFEWFDGNTPIDGVKT